MSDQNSPSESPLDKTIADVIDTLSGLDAESKEYAQATDQLVKLHKLKMEEERFDLELVVAQHEQTLKQEQQQFQQTHDSKRKPLSLDTLALAGANLLGIGIIVWHERDYIMNKNALGFLKNIR